MTKYIKTSYSSGSECLEIICDNLRDFRREISFLRKLKLASSNSYNPIYEFDVEGDNLGFEFARKNNNSTVRVIYKDF